MEKRDLSVPRKPTDIEQRYNLAKTLAELKEKLATPFKMDANDDGVFAQVKTKSGTYNIVIDADGNLKAIKLQ